MVSLGRRGEVDLYFRRGRRRAMPAYMLRIFVYSRPTTFISRSFNVWMIGCAWKQGVAVSDLSEVGEVACSLQAAWIE